ncbi:MAG: fibronectin type III domain-containing protein [Kiritimatiellae bacterium]|nr:fibronectin type III domain-containing protein [Kiritimatiellia bacterium]
MQMRQWRGYGIRAAWVAMVLFRAVPDVRAQPHMPRTGANRLSNPSISGTNSWTLEGAAQYDGAVSRGGGSGSVKLAGVGGILRSRWIGVGPGTTYTFAIYMKSGSWPPPIVAIMFKAYDSGGKFLGNIAVSRQATTDAATWHECVLPYRWSSIHAYIQIVVLTMEQAEQPDGAGAMWLDDAYFGEGIGFEQPPTEKVPFDGAHVRVDALGNFEVFEAGAWKPFFPLAMFCDGDRPDWTLYSEQGFNCSMRSGHWVGGIQKAMNAVSAFNPNGMLCGFQMSQYIGADGWNYGDMEHLADAIADIKAAGLMDRLFCYFWDNEATVEYAVPKAVCETIQAHDVDGTGKRLHPIYMLLGNEGVTRRYCTDFAHSTDVVGDYTGGHGDGLVVIDNIERQRNPVSFGQINLGVGEQFRAIVYTSIMRGARAIGFWRDLYLPSEEFPEFGPIETRPWWPDMPNIRREIDRLMPLIRQPHWTDWQLGTSNTRVNHGTRDYLGEGYVLVANPRSTAETVTYTISGLSYTPTAAHDYFSHEEVTPILGGQFTVTIAPRATAVYRLVRGIGGELISARSSWRYHDLGADLGTGWRGAACDDGAWATGPALLGYGETYVDTTVSYGSDPSDKHPTTYFRKRFTLGVDPSTIGTLTLYARCDDGFVAWLNGRELTRQAMPAGAIGYATLAASHEGDAYEAIDVSANKDMLVRGTNVLAVELHQCTAHSSDLVMDMGLSYTIAESQPMAPNGLSAAAVSHDRIDLTWTDRSDNEYGFRIDRRQSGTPDWGWSGSAAADATAYSDTLLPANTKIYYRIAAYNGAGYSDYSGVCSATTRPLPPPPAAPSGLAAGAPVSSRIALSWTDNSDNEDGMKVDRRQSGTQNWTTIATLEADSCACTNVWLPPDTTFYYKIKAYNAGGDSAYSAVASATTPATPQRPAAPTDLRAKAVSSDRIDLTWTDNSGNEEGFKIDRRQSGLTAWVRAAAPGAGSQSWSDTGLPAVTKFYYKVMAHNADGESPYSPVACATTPAAPADGDLDNMPDVWEIAHLAGTNAAPEADPDQDGVSNEDEYIAGLDPTTNDVACLHLNTALAGGKLVLSFPTIAAAGTGYEGLSRRYAFDYRAGPTNAWTGVPGCTNRLGDGQLCLYTNTLPAAALMYRARVWLE